MSKAHGEKVVALGEALIESLRGHQEEVQIEALGRVTLAVILTICDDDSVTATRLATTLHQDILRSIAKAKPLAN